MTACFRPPQEAQRLRNWRLPRAAGRASQAAGEFEIGGVIEGEIVSRAEGPRGGEACEYVLVIDRCAKVAHGLKGARIFLTGQKLASSLQRQDVFDLEGPDCRRVTTACQGAIDKRCRFSEALVGRKARDGD
jgi:hypothetical protein